MEKRPLISSQEDFELSKSTYYKNITPTDPIVCQSKAKKIALYALTALASMTGIGALFWYVFRAKLKTHQVGIQFFSILSTVVLAMTPIVGWGILYGIKHLVVSPHAKDVVRLQTAVSQSVLDSVQDYANKKTSSLEIPKQFKQQYKKIEDLIDDREKISTLYPRSVSKSYNRLRLLRSSIHCLISHPDFQSFKAENPKDPFILYILFLCHLIRLGGTTTEPFLTFGHIFTKNQISTKKDSFSLREVSDILSDIVRNYKGQNRESPASRVLNLFLNITKTITSLQGEFIPGSYNSYLTGNLDNRGYTYQVIPKGKSSMIEYVFHYGPGPQADQLFEGDLALYKTLFGEKSPGFIQHNLQKQSGPEGVRSKKQLEISRNHPHLTFLTTPMDGNIWKLKGPYHVDKFTSIQHFCSQYALFAHGESSLKGPAFRRFPEPAESKKEKKSSANGFYLPEILSDSEIYEAFDLVGSTIKTPLSKYKEEKKVVLKGAQLLVQASLLLKTMAKSALQTVGTFTSEGEARLLNDLDEELKQLRKQALLGQSCKQDIDRGIALNIITRLLVMQMAGQVITRDLLDEIVGQVIGRAEIVSRRLIIMDRIAPALSTLCLIDENEEFISSLKNYLEAEMTIKEASLSH